LHLNPPLDSIELMNRALIEAAIEQQKIIADMIQEDCEDASKLLKNTIKLIQLALKEAVQ
jgi:hypothetical protein